MEASRTAAGAASKMEVPQNKKKKKTKIQETKTLMAPEHMLWEIFNSAKRVSAGVRAGRPYRQCLCFGRKVTSLASNRTFVR